MTTDTTTTTTESIASAAVDLILESLDPGERTRFLVLLKSAYGWRDLGSGSAGFIAGALSVAIFADMNKINKALMAVAMSPIRDDIIAEGNRRDRGR